MANNEANCVLEQVVDGELVTLYPVTKAECVQGLSERIGTEIQPTVQELQTNINTKADSSALSTTDSRVANLQQQVNNIASLPEGSTTGDAELVQARVGVDGTNYTNLKTRLDTEMTDVKEDLTELEDILGEKIINFSVGTGEHSSKNDRIAITLKSGQSIKVSIKSKTIMTQERSCVVYGYKDSATTGVSLTTLYTNTEKIVAVKDDYDYVGIYVSPGEANNFTFIVSAEGVIQDLENLKNNVNEINTNLLNECKELSDKIEEITENNGVNLYNPYNIERGYGITTLDGEKVINVNTYITDYIELSDIATYRILTCYPGAVKICYYDDNKDFLSTGTGINQSIPDEAKYFRAMYMLTTNPASKIYIFQRKQSDYTWIESIKARNINKDFIKLDVNENDFDNSMLDKIGESFCLYKKDNVEDWEQGTIYSHNGSLGPSPNIIRTKQMFKLAKGTIINISEMACKVFLYDERTDFVRTYDWFGKGYTPKHFEVEISGYYKLIIKDDTASPQPTPNGLSFIGKGQKIVEDTLSLLSNSKEEYSFKVLNTFPFDYTNCTAQTIGSSGVIAAQLKRMLSPIFTLPRGYKIDFSPNVAHIAVFNEQGDVTSFLENQSSVIFGKDTIMRFAARRSDNTDMDATKRRELFNQIIISEMFYEDYPINYKKPKEYIGAKGAGITISAITFIGDNLYVFPYSTNDDHTVFSTGAIIKYNFLSGTYANIGSFTGNIGHNNTVDYNEANGYLLSSNGGSSTNEQPNEIYLFKNAKDLTNFDVTDESCLRIDVSQLGWGKQLNCCWGEDNFGENNIIYCITNYQQGNMEHYDINNVDEFTGASKRFIRRVLLGKGTNQLELGTYTTAEQNEFNGTFKVLKTYERDFVGEYENNNDTCFWDGCIYEGIIWYNAKGGLAYLKHSFDDYGETLKTERIFIPVYNASGTPVQKEPEGIAIKHSTMVIGDGGTIRAFKV